MKKICLALLVSALAVSQSAAAACKKPKAVTNEEALKMDRDNKASLRAMRDAAPFLLPSWAAPLYLSYVCKEDGKKKK